METPKQFLEGYDPQIKEVGYKNYSYNPQQVIDRIDAYRKDLVKELREKRLSKPDRLILGRTYSIGYTDAINKAIELSDGAVLEHDGQTLLCDCKTDEDHSVNKPWCYGCDKPTE
jgi:hypothetical protein